MPLLPYFALIGPALLALLLFAGAKPGPAGPLPNSTAFHGVPKPFKAPESVPILSVRDAPAPDMEAARALAALPIMARGSASEATGAAERPAKLRRAAKPKPPRQPAASARTAQTARERTPRPANVVQRPWPETRFAQAPRRNARAIR